MTIRSFLFYSFLKENYLIYKWQCNNFDTNLTKWTSKFPVPYFSRNHCLPIRDNQNINSMMYYKFNLYSISRKWCTTSTSCSQNAGRTFWDVIDKSINSRIKSYSNVVCSCNIDKYIYKCTTMRLLHISIS